MVFVSAVPVDQKDQCHSVFLVTKVTNPGVTLCYRRPWCKDQEDCKSRYSDHDQRQSGRWVQRGGANWRTQKMSQSVCREGAVMSVKPQVPADCGSNFATTLVLYLPYYILSFNASSLAKIWSEDEIEVQSKICSSFSATWYISVHIKIKIEEETHNHHIIICLIVHFRRNICRSGTWWNVKCCGMNNIVWSAKRSSLKGPLTSFFQGF